MLTQFQFPNYGENDDKDKKPTTTISATTSIHVAPIACTQCQIRNVPCDRIKPTCHECIQHSLQCQYNSNTNAMTATTITAATSSNTCSSTTAALLTESIRDPNQLREIETRLKKMETQLTARTQSSSFSSSSTHILPLQQLQKKQRGDQPPSTITTTKKKPIPRFELEPVTGALCIETEINEAHHFIKLLFSTINVEKIQHIAHNVFAGHLPNFMDDSSTGLSSSSSISITRDHHDNNNTNPLLDNLKNKPLDLLLNDLLAHNEDAVEQQWLNMVINTQHHRCMIFYQMVNSKYSANTDYLRQQHYHHGDIERTRELLLAMALRAYIYHHEDKLHQDTPFPVQTSMGPVYLQCALSLLEDCYTTSHRTTIRALLHLFMYHLHDKPEEAFPYCDLAVRMTQDLNLHKKPQRNIYDDYYQQQRDNEDNTINSNGYSNKQMQAEDDRRLWWAAYWCQLYTTVEYNRPTVVEDEEIEIPMPRKLSFENAAAGYCIDYCVMSIKLLRLRRSIAAALKSSDTTHALLYQVRDLETSLDEWFTDLPEYAKLHSSSSGQQQQQQQQQQDTLSTELGLLLHAQYYSIKLQMYECFLNNATALSFVAVNNCGKAAAGVTKMLVQYGSTMRMCSCVRIVPTLHRCVAMLRYNAEFKESDAIASQAVEHLRMLGSVLRCHSFKYVQGIVAVVSLIDKTLQLYPAKSTSSNPIAPAPNGSLQPQQPSSSSLLVSNIEGISNINHQHPIHLTSSRTSTFPSPAASNHQQQQQYPSQFHDGEVISVVKQQPMDTMTQPLSTAASNVQNQPTVPSSSIATASQQSSTKKRQQNRSATTTNSNTNNTSIASTNTSFSVSTANQIQQMAAPIGGIGGFNIEQFSQEHVMNVYQQSIIPLSSSSSSFTHLDPTASQPKQQTPSTKTTNSTFMASQQYGQSFPIATLASSIPNNDNNTTQIASFPQQQQHQQQTSSAPTLQQQSSSSTDQAWTASIPMNPEALALLGISSTENIPSVSSQQQQHHNNSILPQQQQQPTIPSSELNNNIHNSNMYISQLHSQHHHHHQQQQRPSMITTPPNDNNNDNRPSPFSQGSIFHRAPTITRPTSNNSHSMIEDPYLTKFPLITPPIIASSLYQRQQQEEQEQQICTTITELTPYPTTDDSTSNSGSNATNFDAGSSIHSGSNTSITSMSGRSSQRPTQSPPIMDSNSNSELTPFYQSMTSSSPSDMDRLSPSSLSSHGQRRSPSNPLQQPYYFS